MAGVEVLAGLGMMATEIFKYNRENFEFDQDQRFEREELRLKMQVERFTLFREDIRDLVELTVGKMDLYHLVGALFLKGVVLYYAKGTFENASPPKTLTTLYYVSNACAAVYLLLAIWMAMHASIACTSYGVRLLTRFVRLPIPGSQQLNVLNARMADFERQGATMMRVPFMQRTANDWKQRGMNDQLEHDRAEDTLAAAQGLSDVQTSAEDLDAGEQGLTDQTELLKAVELSTYRHVQLFRQLQAQWQCYDAYARVSMALGVRQMLQGTNYFVIGFTMVDNCEPMAAVVLTVTIQSIATALSILDIHGLPCWGNFDLQVMGSMPAFLTCLSLILATRTEGDCAKVGEDQCVLDPTNRYMMSVGSLGLEIIWFQLLLWVSSPSKDDQALPRHFRTVLFMDVFGDVDDPTEINYHTGEKKLHGRAQEKAKDVADDADIACSAAQAALWRWSAARDAGAELTNLQKSTLTTVKKDFEHWSAELKHVKRRHKLPAASGDSDEDTPAVVGPFERRGGELCYYRVEKRKFVNEVPSGCKLQTLTYLNEEVHILKGQVKKLRDLYGVRYDKRGGAPRDEAESNSDSDGEHVGGAASRGTDLTHASGGRGGAPEQEPAARGGEAVKEVKIHAVKLPWRILRTLTRAIQLIWFLVGVQSAMEECGLTEDPDFRVLAALGRNHHAHSEHSEHPERRLLSAGPPVGGAARPQAWPFDRQDVDWPHGPLFRPDRVHCPPGLAGGAGALVGSPFAWYGLLGSRGHELRLEELSGVARPAGRAPLCPPGSGALGGLGCLAGSLASGGVLVEATAAAGPPPEAVLLPVAGAGAGAGWRHMAGAIVPCSSAPWLPVPLPASGGALCLMLAGWGPSSGRIQLAAAPLPNDTSGRPGLPEDATPLRPLLELAPDTAPAGKGAGGRVAAEVLALHLSVGGKRLWALTGGGELVAWDLRGGRPRTVAHLRPELPEELSAAGGFRVAGVCEDASGGLLLVGSAGRDGGRPELLWAAGPSLDESPA